MDAAAIQAKVYYGYAKAAAHLGLPFQQFRPTGPTNPTSGSPRATLPATFTVAGSTFAFGRSAKHEDALFNVLIDGSQTQVGDYLVGATDTYFIASQQPMLPILAVRCNRVVTVATPGPAQAFGPSHVFSGTTTANEAALATGVPVSLLFDARGRSAEVGLPTDLPSPYFEGLFPLIPGLDLRTSLILTDEQTPSRRYIVAAAEKTHLGWRVWAQQAVT